MDELKNDTKPSVFTFHGGPLKLRSETALERAAAGRSNGEIFFTADFTGVVLSHGNRISLTVKWK